jgi:hypothetical protein
MQKVKMIVHGREAMVDSDMVTKMIKKQALVNSLMYLQAHASEGPAINELFEKQVKHLIRLNRTIRQTVSFIL